MNYDSRIDDGELVTLPYLDISVVPSALRIVAKKLA